MVYNLRNIHVRKDRLTGKNIWEITGIKSTTFFTGRKIEKMPSLFEEDDNICNKEVSKEKT